MKSHKCALVMLNSISKAYYLETLLDETKFNILNLTD